jgi:hypothetical protein
MWAKFKEWLAGVRKGLLNIWRSKTFWALVAVLVVDRLKRAAIIPDTAATDAIEVVGLLLAAVFRAGATQDLQAPK